MSFTKLGRLRFDQVQQAQRIALSFFGARRFRQIPSKIAAFDSSAKAFVSCVLRS